MSLIGNNEVVHQQEKIIPNDGVPVSSNDNDFRVIDVYGFFGLNPHTAPEEDVRDVKLVFEWLKSQNDMGLGFIFPLRKLSSDIGQNSIPQLKRIATKLRLNEQIKQLYKESQQI